MRTDTTDALYTQAYRNVGTDENGNPMMEAAEEDPTGTLYYIESFQYVGSGSAGACYTPVIRYGITVFLYRNQTALISL